MYSVRKRKRTVYTKFVEVNKENDRPQYKSFNVYLFEHNFARQNNTLSHAHGNNKITNCNNIMQRQYQLVCICRSC